METRRTRAPRLTADYDDHGYGNVADWGFGPPYENQTDVSFWHRAAQGWADPRVGIFLSRHRDEPKANAKDVEDLVYADSEIMTG